MAGTLTISTLSDGTNSTSATNTIKGSAKAWVNFHGSTGVINGSFNVSSVTRNTNGDYTITYTTAMTNANYSAIPAGNQNVVSGYNWSIGISQATAPTTSSIRLLALDGSSSSVNPPIVTLAIFSS